MLVSCKLFSEDGIKTLNFFRVCLEKRFFSNIGVAKLRVGLICECGFSASSNSKCNICFLIYYLKIAIFLWQVVFEGVRGRGQRSDIAIDDVKVVSGECVAPGM